MITGRVRPEAQFPHPAGTVSNNSRLSQPRSTGPSVRSRRASRSAATPAADVKGGSPGGHTKGRARLPTPGVAGTCPNEGHVSLAFDRGCRRPLASRKETWVSLDLNVR